MAYPTVAEATRYLKSVGLILESIPERHYRYRLRREDGMGPEERFEKFAYAWNWWERDVHALLIEAAWVVRILKEMKDSSAKRSPVFHWLVNGGILPEVMARLERAEVNEHWRMPRYWRQAAGPWLAISPINSLSFVPTMPAMLRHSLRILAPAEAQQWFNETPPINAEDCNEPSADLGSRSS